MFSQVLISSMFYAGFFHTKDLFSPQCNLRKALLYEKRAHKILIKLKAGRQAGQYESDQFN